MSAGFTIKRGLAPHHRDLAAALYWQAFRGKLQNVLGPDDKALRFLRRMIDPGFALSAVSERGELLGVAGFKTAEGALIGGGLRDLRDPYGWFGAIWRGVALSLLERDTVTATLLMDGIFVAEAARGQGVGTALLDAIKAEAMARDLSSVRLDVIDTNPKARALYEREGFVPIGESDIGPLRWIFGFRRATAMVWTANQAVPQP